MTPVFASPNGKPVGFIRIHQAFDFLAGFVLLLTVFAATNASRMPEGWQQFLALRITVKNCGLLLLLMVLWCALLQSFSLYKIEQYRSPVKGMLRFVAACSVVAVFALVFPLSSNSGEISHRTIIIYWLILALTGVLVRSAIGVMMHYVPSLGNWRRNILIVGTGPCAARIAQEIETEHHASERILGFIDDDLCFPTPRRISQRWVGTIADLEPILMREVVDQVIVALPVRSRYDAIQTAISVCERTGVEVRYPSATFHLELANPDLDSQGGFSYVVLKPFRDDPGAAIAKRCLDVAGSFVGLVLLSPLMLLAAILIKLHDRGPVFFVQERFGLNKRIFRMYKFRTMVRDAEALQSRLEQSNEAIGPVFKMRADPRVTRIGRFLRKTSIDELPQLLNVFSGHMSLVGPRPLPRRDVSNFNDGWLMRRFSVKPGITCLWQISGRSNTTFEQWIAKDLEYIDRWSFLLDLKILARTFPAVVKGSGAM